jgi:hypothetical protein
VHGQIDASRSAEDKKKGKEKKLKTKMPKSSPSKREKLRLDTKGNLMAFLFTVLFIAQLSTPSWSAQYIRNINRKRNSSVGPKHLAVSNGTIRMFLWQKRTKKLSCLRTKYSPSMVAQPPRLPRPR